MPEEQVVQEQQTQEQVPVDTGIDMAAVDKAAGEFFQEQGTTESTQPRDEQGRFVSTRQPTIEPIWLDAAKEAGIPESEIGSFTSIEQIEDRIAAQRIMQARKAVEVLGIDPAEYMAWQQARSQQQPQATTTTPGQPSAQEALAELQLKIDEESLGEELSGPLKAIVDELNKTKGVLKQNAELQRRIEALESGFQQSAQRDQISQREKAWAETWDRVAAQVPGYTEHFGKPSELKQLMAVRPDDPRAVDAVAFDNYFQSSWKRFSRSFGESEVALKLALADAWEKAPFSRLAGGNGKTNGVARNGSVVRHTARRANGATRLGVEVDSVDQENGVMLEKELKAISDRLGVAWDDNQGNPFAQLGQ